MAILDGPPTLFTPLIQKEIRVLTQKMMRVINDPRVPDYAWQDAEEVYRDVVCEALRRWHAGRWKK